MNLRERFIKLKFEKVFRRKIISYITPLPICYGETDKYYWLLSYRQIGLPDYFNPSPDRQFSVILINKVKKGKTYQGERLDRKQESQLCKIFNYRVLAEEYISKLE